MKKDQTIHPEGIRAVLQSVSDPELGVSIMDLGLVYDVAVSSAHAVTIRMTLTSMGCPLFPVIEKEIKDALKEEYGIAKESIIIELVFDPPWSIEHLTENGKALLGIA